MKRSGIETKIDNNILHKLQDAFVLGVYCYLKSLPPNKKIDKNEISNHFGVGIGKIKNIFCDLHGYCLIDYSINRCKKGRISSVDILVK